MHHGAIKSMPEHVAARSACVGVPRGGANIHLLCARAVTFGALREEWARYFLTTPRKCGLPIQNFLCLHRKCQSLCVLHTQEM